MVGKRLMSLVLLHALCVPVASAATFCVNSMVALQAAMDTAKSNGEDDTIRMLAGNYAFGARMLSKEPHSIRIVGGYGTACIVPTGETTTLSGEGVVRPISIYNRFGAIEVSRLTFVNGLGGDEFGGAGGMALFSDSGNIRVELNRFIFNRSDVGDSGALIAITEGGELVIRNNLFFGNSAPAVGAATLIQNNDGTAFVSSNTIYGNQSDNGSQFGSPVAGGLQLGVWNTDGQTNGARFQLSNNIIWGNTGNGAVDMRTESPNVRFANDIGSVGGAEAVPIASAMEQNVAPGFASCAFPCFNFELTRNSPLVDAGLDNPAGGSTTSDLAGKPRTIGPFIDIGAFENDLLFADGFE
jgi:hypothetical protein